ncbi:MAG: helix-hairpin-helix domain-containing protein [Bacteroidota bacterium]
MFKQLTDSQKRGALILVGVLVIIIGWQVRVAYLKSQNGSSALNRSEIVEGNDQPAAQFAAKQKDQRRKTVIRIELNTADTAKLQTVKGIGPVYARKIVTFRETYGGIVDPQQLIDALRLKPDAWLRLEPQIFADTATQAYRDLKRSAKEKQDYLRSLSENNRPRSNYRNDWNRRKNSRRVDFAPPSESTYSDSPDKSSPKNLASHPKLQPVDVNGADSIALVAIPGIGPRTAQEIVKFREGTGFIYSLNQIETLWCVREENWDRMKAYLLVNGPFDQYPHIQINSGTVEDLATHKFIRWKDARLIVAYRDQHGPFASVDDLKKMHGLDQDRIDKIAPYLAY